jgi:hypothetical protein
MSPDLWSPRPRSPLRRRPTSGRRDPEAHADVARPPATATPWTSPDLRPPRPQSPRRCRPTSGRCDLGSIHPPCETNRVQHHHPPRRRLLDLYPAITRLSFLLPWASSSSPVIARPQHRARASTQDQCHNREVNYLFHFPIPVSI